MNSFQSEKQTFIRFILLYSFLCLSIFAFMIFIYYNFEKDNMLSRSRSNLQELSIEQIQRLKTLHREFEEGKIYPRDKRFDSGIFDSDAQKIFATNKTFEAELGKIVYKKGDFIYFIRELESFYLGAKYLVLQIKDDGLWMDRFVYNLLIFGSLMIIFAVFVGYLLASLLISPMKNAITLLDDFIKDTTHELNTPISSILANIETLQETSLEPKVQKKIQRIKIAAKTVSNLYNDLTYVLLNNKQPSKDELVNIAEVCFQRVEYFKPIADMKKIEIYLEINGEFTLYIDRQKISKLIDNLISNAIKYNRPNGYVKVYVYKDRISIKDDGIGMPEHKIDKAFTRFSRFERSKGGFGIGLSIVKMIADEYELDISIDSSFRNGTTVNVSRAKRT